MTKPEALRLALAAFNSKYIVGSGAWRVQQDQAAKACEEALAQPELEADGWRKHASEYERGFIDGMQKQMQSSVDRAVNAMAKREWVDLGIEEVDPICEKYKDQPYKLYVEIRNLLKEKNNG